MNPTMCFNMNSTITTQTAQWLIIQPMLLFLTMSVFFIDLLAFCYTLLVAQLNSGALKRLITYSRDMKDK